MVKLEKTSLGRGCIAWLGSCFVAALAMSSALGVADYWESFHGRGTLFIGRNWPEILWLPIGLTGLIAAMTAFPVLVAVLIIRHYRFKRGWADIVIGGLPGYYALGAAAVVGSDQRWGDAVWRDMIGLGGVLLISGWCAGCAYWLFAGRPQPPYE